MDNRYVSGCSSGVERLLPKQDVVGSNPITRSNYIDLSGLLRYREQGLDGGQNGSCVTRS